MSHGGNVELAHEYIHMAAKAGADLVKFQCHRGQEGKRVWQDFTNKEWKELKATCVANGVEFFCTPFSLEAVKLLNPLVKRWKVSGGMVTNLPLLKALHQTEKQTLLSLGMANMQEYFAAYPWCYDCVPMRCISIYPTPPEKYSTYLLRYLSPRYGLSDHSGSIWPGVIACWQQAAYVELHVKDHRSVGNDLDSSVTYDDFRRLADARDFIASCPRGGIDYQGLPEIRDVRDKYLYTPPPECNDL